MGLHIRRVGFNREKELVINLILNDEFCGKILPVLQQEYFKSQATTQIIEWVKLYHEEYGVAPKEHIQTMYDEHRIMLDSEVADGIERTLQHLSEVADTENSNTQYLVDNAINLCKEKHLTLQIEAAQHHLQSGSLLEAENVMHTPFEGAAIASGGWESFANQEFMREVIRGMVEQQDEDTAFFQFSGKLGRFIGPVDRGWFLAFLAPAKRGKTTYMMEAAIDGIYQKLNVVVMSLEMPKKKLSERYLLRVTGQKPSVKGQVVMTPIMDCKLNQTGECELDECTSLGAVMDDGKLESYKDNPNWEVCTACRGKRGFIPSAWKVPIEKKYYTESEYNKKASTFNDLFGRFGRIIDKPSKTATVSDLREEVKHLILTENFVPDMIVIDYADLLLPEQSTGVKRHDLDDIWEALRSWGQADNVLIVTASQTNRLSADAEYVKDTHVAEDYSKIAKLDVGIGLCQTDQMKEMGMINLNKIAHRHMEYVQSHVCTVLQELSYQQASLDSEFVAK